MLGHLLEARGQFVGVQRAHRRQSSEHDQVERPVQELDAFCGCLVRSVRHLLASLVERLGAPH